jgi:ATP-dependent helicase/nuclease subunit B
VRSALLLLRWLYEPLEESELDWLLLSTHCAASETEWLDLARTMLTLRENGHEQPHWTIAEFTAAGISNAVLQNLFTTWAARIESARQLSLSAPRRQSPFDWATFASRILETLLWPGFHPESSAAYQARDRWETLLESCAALGFNGSEVEWPSFVASLTQAAAETIFAVESSHAQVQITEPLTSAGQTADAIWFLGAHEESWPGRGQPHPLIPLPVQRDSNMPHSSHLADWELAHNATTRILHSASQVVFSYAHHAAEVEQRPSRLITHFAGSPTPLPAPLHQNADMQPESLVELFEDFSEIPFTGIANSPRTAVGGAETLSAQSLCPFQSFANKRLNAPAFDPAETGLNARQRGQLLHSVLHRIWSGPSRGGIATHSDLISISDLEPFVRAIVTVVMRESFQSERRSPLPDRFPARILELESERLTRLVTEWLNYERTRLPFTVAATERKAGVTIAGLRLNLRLDRVDHVQINRVNENHMLENQAQQAALVIDYKSSAVGPSAWAGPRPDDVQLPLYATHALNDPIEGLLIAQVRSGQDKFCGRVEHASQSLFAQLSAGSSLVKDPLTADQLNEWRVLIEHLAADFLQGVAAVSPKDPIKTCAACGLHSICRIHDNQPLSAFLADPIEESADDSGAENA